MPQMREFVVQNQFRLVRLQHVLRQIYRRNQAGKARRFDRTRSIDARSSALAEKTPVAVQPNREHHPHTEQPKPKQRTAARPDNLKALRCRQRLCHWLYGFLCRGNRLLRGCLRLCRRLHRLLDNRHGLCGQRCVLCWGSRVLRRKKRQ